jgi:hypothetical protein
MGNMTGLDSVNTANERMREKAGGEPRNRARHCALLAWSTNLRGPAGLALFLRS